LKLNAKYVVSILSSGALHHYGMHARREYKEYVERA